MTDYRIYFDDDTSIVRQAENEIEAMDLGCMYLDATQPGSDTCVDSAVRVASRIFGGLSTVAFPHLGLTVQVSRQLQSACVLSSDHAEAIGVLDRKSTGQVDWAPVSGQKLPVEVLDVVATMI